MKVGIKLSFFKKIKNIFGAGETAVTKENEVTLQPEAGLDDIKTVDVQDLTYYHENMQKSRGQIMTAFTSLMESYDVVDADYFEELEDALIMADVGLNTVLELSATLQKQVQDENITSPQEVNELIVEELYEIYMQSVSSDDFSINYNANGPTVILFVGVNGAGKTTSIGKLAYRLKADGKKVLLAAGDTFRAGAVDQLERWAERVDADIVKGKEGSDPSGVIFDAVRKAKNENYDILLCDTAGRLQNKVNLMNELQKMYRVIDKELPGAPHETFLVIDATTGQNGLSQAKSFTEVAPLTGVILSKLDGSAKGGIALAIAKELGLPVKFIGLGEKITDISPFILENYLYGLFADLFEMTNLNEGDGNAE